MRLWKLWFQLSGRVSRRDYLLSGIALVALKYALDVALVYATARQLWTPLDYLNPLISARKQASGEAPSWTLLSMGAFAIPFLWIGVSMTLRRCVDAGLSPWFALAFFLPLLNWLWMAALCLLATSPRVALPSRAEATAPEDAVRAALVGTAAGLGVALVMGALHLGLLKSYGAAMFLGTPFTMSSVAGFLFNRRTARSPGATVNVALLTLLLAAGGMLVFAFEGGVCLLMAAPLVIAVGALGGLLGRAIALHHTSSWLSAGSALLLLPLGATLEARLPQQPALREVASSVEIDAPPALVWPHVLQFRELTSAPELIFRMGIAYPVRARIEGQGVGAVRRCEFSTGAFVEPITAWEAPTRLAFEVTAQPPPLREWSPYGDVQPPHLAATLQSKRGEFRLVALPGGRTRLEGSTWYTLEMAPLLYWAPWSDWLIHRIHLRVLEHVKAEAERS